MISDRLEFLNRFDKFYNLLVNRVKENKISEKDFYIIIRAKCREMDQEIRVKEFHIK